MEKGGRGFSPAKAFFAILVVLMTFAVSRMDPRGIIEDILNFDHEQPTEESDSSVPGERRLDVRVDRVRVFDVHDVDGTGEFSLHTLAIRKYEESADLSYPPEGHAEEMRPGEVIDLGGFSLAVHNVRADEAVHIYFLGLDMDNQSTGAEAATDAAIAGLVEALQLLLANGGVLPQTLAELTGLAGLGQVSADWLRQADVVGFYHFVLTPDNDWLANQQMDIVSAEGNMQLQYSVLASNSIFAGGSSAQQPSGGSSQVQPRPAATQPPSLVLTSPVYNEYRNPIPFRWTGDPNGQYIVYLRHAEPESTNHHTSGAITGLSWEFHIPKEQYGYWEVFVTTADGGVRSETVKFIFNPNPAD